MANYSISIAGDSGVDVVFASQISQATTRLVRAAADALRATPIPGVTELVPTFCSLLVCYDPGVILYDDLLAELDERLVDLRVCDLGPRRVVKVPVCYGGSFGPDLPTVAAHAGLSEDEVVAIHAGCDYLIDMLGFLPGFAYLGGLDPRLHTPRLAQPRTRIEPGSVGIGGAQTGVYPLASPGGWQIIGRTPLALYDPHREPAILYAAGDYLRFCPIDEDEYHRIEALVAQGAYTCDVVVGEG